MKLKPIIVITILLLIILLLRIFIPSLNESYIKTGALYISEIMPSNYKTIKDNYGEYSDYIELHNDTKVKINLLGYHLSDSEFETDKWVFPDIDILPGEYLLIYATKLDECDIVNRICHTNFKLSSKGETLTLTDNRGNIISKFTYPELSSDVSYGLSKNKYIKFSKATPGKVNDKEELKIKNNNYKLEITEYMTHNKRYNYDNHGAYYDWVEIHNMDTIDVTLDNIYISDDETNLKKYKIPETNISKDEYLIIYFSKDPVPYEDAIYADFGLSDTDKYILISFDNKIIDKVEIVPLKDNISYGKVKDEWFYFTSPTPASPNTTAHFKEIGGKNASS